MGPTLDLEWLRDFIALAESGNFSRAAKERAIAQPAFSRHIRALEEWVGVELLDRSTHPASLTEAGKQFLPPAQDLLQRTELARQKAQSGHDRESRMLRFAATHALSLAFFPEWLSSLEMAMRIGPIQMISDNFYACEDLMLQNKVHFLLCHGHPAVVRRVDQAGYPHQVLRQDLLVPVSSPADNGGPRHVLRAGDKVPLLLYSPESGLGHIMRSLLGTALDDETHDIVFTSHHAVLLKTMALEGRGIAWLPRSLIESELDTAHLIVAAESKHWNVPLEIRLFRQPGELPALAQSLWDVAAQRLVSRG